MIRQFPQNEVRNNDIQIKLKIMFYDIILNLIYTKKIMTLKKTCLIQFGYENGSIPLWDRFR